jgi:hypothetical protein
MVLPRHASNKLQNLDYNKRPFQKVQFVPIAFDGHAFFELSLMLLIMHRPLQM